MQARAPLVFGIGLPHSGGDLLAKLFEANGHLWRHHLSGKLAQSIAYARAAGTAPLNEWHRAVGFSDLYRMHKRHLPHLRVQDFVTYLHQQFPDAYFIHTHRDPADFVTLRFWADEGEHRTHSAWHAGVTIADLPAHWTDDQAAHRAFCNTYFKDSSRYLSIKITPQITNNIAKFLNNDFRLTALDAVPDSTVSPKDIAAVGTYLASTPSLGSLAPIDMKFASQVAKFCTQTINSSGTRKALSRVAVTWGADGDVTIPNGSSAALKRNTQNSSYVLKPGSDALERAQGTLNDLIAHGANSPLHIDMMDARHIGSKGRRIPPPRTIVYNRRASAVNLTLWPLPAYHSLAPTGDVGGFPKDAIPFEQKDDRCVWLGNMTGRMSPVLTPEGRPKRGVYNIRSQAELLSPRSAEWADLIADLSCVVRYNIVKTYRDHPDFKVGLVLRDKWKRLARTPAFNGLCDPKRTRTWFHKFRYILSLAGNDTGSNFLSAASSNALILKEEDGWELFYTDAFKPWTHYVPLTEGALDVEEKLAWARANPDKARAISCAATDLYDKFANPHNRAAFLRAITATLNADLD